MLNLCILLIIFSLYVNVKSTETNVTLNTHEKHSNKDSTQITQKDLIISTNGSIKKIETLGIDKFSSTKKITGIVESKSQTFSIKNDMIRQYQPSTEAPPITLENQKTTLQHTNSSSEVIPTTKNVKLLIGENNLIESHDTTEFNRINSKSVRLMTLKKEALLNRKTTVYSTEKINQHSKNYKTTTESENIYIEKEPRITEEQYPNIILSTLKVENEQLQKQSTKNINKSFHKVELKSQISNIKESVDEFALIKQKEYEQNVKHLDRGVIKDSTSIPSQIKSTVNYTNIKIKGRIVPVQIKEIKRTNSNNKAVSQFKWRHHFMIMISILYSMKINGIL